MNFLTKMYVGMQSHLQSKMKDEEGATMVEYALMVALIAIAALAGAQLVGTNVLAAFNAIAAELV